MQRSSWNRIKKKEFIVVRNSQSPNNSGCRIIICIILECISKSSKFQFWVHSSVGFGAILCSPATPHSNAPSIDLSNGMESEKDTSNMFEFYDIFFFPQLQTIKCNYQEPYRQNTFQTISMVSDVQQKSPPVVCCFVTFTTVAFDTFPWRLMPSACELRITRFETRISEDPETSNIYSPWCTSMMHLLLVANKHAFLNAKLEPRRFCQFMASGILLGSSTFQTKPWANDAKWKLNPIPRAFSCFHYNRLGEIVFIMSVFSGGSTKNLKRGSW